MRLRSAVAKGASNGHHKSCTQQYRCFGRDIKKGGWIFRKTLDLCFPFRITACMYVRGSQTVRAQSGNWLKYQAKKVLLGPIFDFLVRFSRISDSVKCKITDVNFKRNYCMRHCTWWHFKKVQSNFISYQNLKQVTFCTIWPIN